MDLEARMDKFDKRLNAIARLVQQGMRMLVDNKAETDRKINALVDAQLRTESTLERLAESHTRLAEAQKVTEQKLQTFIDSLQKGRNGHKRSRN